MIPFEHSPATLKRCFTLLKQRAPTWLRGVDLRLLLRFSRRLHRHQAAQLRRNFLVHGEKDGQAIFEALGTQQKELLWIEVSNQRFYAYNYFGQHPERLVGWFDLYMGGAIKQASLHAMSA